jgi:hypothetical protein
MSELNMWFGTRDYMQWVPCPLVDADMSKTGWQTEALYLNGGARVHRSSTAHKEYNLSWGLQSRDNIRLVTDYADGIYGDGPIYFIDPFAADRNVLPQYWAAPMLAGDDAPLLHGTVTPSLTATDTNSLGYPIKSATYSTNSSYVRPQLFIPIPPNMTFWIGAHGTATGSSVVKVTPTVGVTGLGTPVSLTLLAVNTITRVDTSFDGASYSGVLIELNGTGTITLAGLIGQILPTGTTPSTGGFISGQGHSGCQFAEQPKLQNYSSAMDKVALTARLVETQAWV